MLLPLSRRLWAMRTIRADSRRAVKLDNLAFAKPILAERLLPGGLSAPSGPLGARVIRLRAPRVSA